MGQEIAVQTEEMRKISNRIHSSFVNDTNEATVHRIQSYSSIELLVRNTLDPLSWRVNSLFHFIHAKIVGTETIILTQKKGTF